MKQRRKLLPSSSKADVRSVSCLMIIITSMQKIAYVPILLEWGGKGAPRAFTGEKFLFIRLVTVVQLLASCYSDNHFVTLNNNDI